MLSLPLGGPGGTRGTGGAGGWSPTTLLCVAVSVQLARDRPGFCLSPCCRCGARRQSQAAFVVIISFQLSVPFACLLKPCCCSFWFQMRRSTSITGSLDSPLSALSTEVAEREAALTKQLAAAEARAQSAAAERDAIKVRMLKRGGGSAIVMPRHPAEGVALVGSGCLRMQQAARLDTMWLMHGSFGRHGVSHGMAVNRGVCCSLRRGCTIWPVSHCLRSQIRTDA